MSIKGLKKLEAQLNKALRDIEGATKEAFTDIVLDLTGKAVELAPLDTGDLRGSGKAEINGVTIATGTKEGSLEIKGNVATASEYEAIISFSTPYALRQHEELEYNHPEGGQAKYLEQPFQENIDKYVKRLRDSVKKEVN